MQQQDTGEISMGHTKEEQRQAVRERYARAAAESEPCCGSDCCGEGSAEDTSRAVGYSARELAEVPDDANLGLGCGNPTALASLRPGEIVLDLGSGAGIDCFLAAREVGETGRVIGVDMTPQMVSRARANAEEGGYSNVEFRLGEIEALPVADGTVDVIISNCVLNLSPEKEGVLAEAFRVLKPGGRVVVSDMVSDLPVPDVVSGSLDAVAGCLPTERQTYLRQFREAGFTDVRITEEKPYPSAYILADSGVHAFIEARPEHRAELEAFAGSIAGAHFEATKPSS
jgi:SAM-dependent methyltransferase